VAARHGARIVSFYWSRNNQKMVLTRIESTRKKVILST